jgi:hypothetical protein
MVLADRGWVPAGTIRPAAGWRPAGPRGTLGPGYRDRYPPSTTSVCPVM